MFSGEIGDSLSGSPRVGVLMRARGARGTCGPGERPNDVRGVAGGVGGIKGWGGQVRRGGEPGRAQIAPDPIEQGLYMQPVRGRCGWCGGGKEGGWG